VTGKSLDDESWLDPVRLDLPEAEESSAADTSGKRIVAADPNETEEASDWSDSVGPKPKEI
jgi:hypothetical protein